MHNSQLSMPSAQADELQKIDNAADVASDRSSRTTLQTGALIIRINLSDSDSVCPESRGQSDTHAGAGSRVLGMCSANRAAQPRADFPSTKTLFIL